MAFSFPFLFMFFEVTITREESYVFKLISTITSKLIRGNYSQILSYDALIIFLVGIIFAVITLQMRKKCFRFELS